MFSNGAVLNRPRKDLNLYEFNFDMNVCNVLAAQGYGQICSHIDIINRYKVKLFIELGTYMGGGLTHLIPNLELDPEFSYLGFEENVPVISEKIKNYAATHPRCSLVMEDMFLPSNVARISTCISSTQGVVYIFCDGGNKARELFTFSSMMKVGDIISIHDYTDDQTGEIKDADLAKLGDAFVPLDEEWRKNILWLPTFMRIR